MSAEIDWVKIQNRRSSGESVGALAKELGVSDATIYNHTKATNGASVPQRKLAKAPRTPRVPAGKVSSNGRFSGLIAELRAERDELNAVIALLEKRQ